ncbi:MAG: hypothetical protein IJT25_00175 [Clostridia bacterium]|nr:hypothetical protein [Clostridia bacterium]
MGNLGIRELAQKAKSRLKNVSANLDAIENNGTVKRASLSQHEYASIASKIKDEDDPLYKKVEKILERNPDTISPIGELIDKNIYNNLNETEKERYVLCLSKKYAKFKEKILSEKNREM